jgi:UDP:flavonoid glycosyltransferase YjiC (YdhE family)
MDRTRRLLVVTLNAAGNWPPELSLIRALVQRGHTVRVLTEADLAPQVTAAGAEYGPYHTVAPRDRTVRHDTSRESALGRLIRVTYLNPAYGDDLLTEVRRFAPDVLLVDRMLMAAIVAAESTGLPTALLWHTIYGAWMRTPPRDQCRRARPAQRPPGTAGPGAGPRRAPQPGAGARDPGVHV